MHRKANRTAGGIAAIWKKSWNRIAGAIVGAGAALLFPRLLNLPVKSEIYHWFFNEWTICIGLFFFACMALLVGLDTRADAGRRRSLPWDRLYDVDPEVSDYFLALGITLFASVFLLIIP